METLFPLTIRSSMWSTYTRCPLEWAMENIFHLSRGGECRNPDLIFGQAVAYGCEVTRKSFYNQGLSVSDSIEAGMEAVRSYQDTGDSFKSNEAGANLLRRYFTKYRLDTGLTPVVLANGEKAIEYEFLFELPVAHPDFPDKNIRFGGRLDGLYHREVHGRTFIHPVDEKTCKTVFRQYGTKHIDLQKEEAQWVHSNQLASYAWTVNQLLAPMGLESDDYLIYRLPVPTKEVTEPFELSIPRNKFREKLWITTFISALRELVERYKFMKASGCAPWEAFEAKGGTACTKFGQRCRFEAGCLYEKGQLALANEFQQLVRLDYSSPYMPLADYKKLILENKV